MLGAFYTYQAVAKEIDLIAYTEDDFQIEAVSNAFYGTFYAKANDFPTTPDTIDVFKPKQAIQYPIEADNDFILNGLYDDSFLNKRDQYAYFLGGNYAKTVITSSV